MTRFSSYARLATLATASLPLLLGACRTPEQDTDSTSRESAANDGLAPALVLEGTAYDSAARIALPPEAPEEFEGLHNVYHLSESIVSGSEPQDARALQLLADMGIRTIISVDGKAPDADAAGELGMRYVHIPIQYKGLTRTEIGDLAKTFRELEGPFYVHCFHGKHRGPAAAAVGRILLDGADRQTAIAEMRQYCGTASRYEGLYRDIATAYLPPARETAARRFDFPAVQLPKGVVGAMVELGRAHDNIELLVDNGFALSAEHPDLDPRNEAKILLQAFEASLQLDEVRQGPADYRGWFQESRDAAKGLVSALERGDDPEEAKLHWSTIQASCSACHLVYRN